MQARRAALLNLNESYDGLGDAMATDPTEIPVDFLRAQPLLAVQMAALVVAPGRMQEVGRVASRRTKEFPTAFARSLGELRAGQGGIHRCVTSALEGGAGGAREGLEQESPNLPQKLLACPGRSFVRE